MTKYRTAIFLVTLGCHAAPSLADHAAVHTYVIERNVEGAGKLSAAQLRDMSRKSRDVLDNLGPGIRWVRSYVVDDKFYCVYTAPNKEMIWRHAREAGFPADRISEVRNVIGPKTAEPSFGGADLGGVARGSPY